MTRNEYLIDLALALEKNGICTDEMKRTLEFCGEMIDDMMEEGMTEEQAVSSMGEVVEIARRMMEEGKETDEEIAPPEGNVVCGGTIVREEGDRTRIHRAFDPFSIREIVIRDENNSVTLQAGDELAADITVSGEDTYTTEVKDGVLTVQHRNIKREQSIIRRIFQISGKREKMVFTVPDTWHGGVDVRTGNASVEARDMKLSFLSIHTGNGHVNAERIETEGALFAGTSNASVTAADVKAGEVSIKTSNARIALSGVTAAGDVTAVTSNGGISADMLTASGGVVLSTRNGSVKVQDIDAAHIKLATSNAGIKGSVAGKREDYRIVSRTSNGRNNLGSSENGQRVLEVITSNAGINIEFSE